MGCVLPHRVSEELSSGRAGSKAAAGVGGQTLNETENDTNVALGQAGDVVLSVVEARRTYRWRAMAAVVYCTGPAVLCHHHHVAWVPRRAKNRRFRGTSFWRQWGGFSGVSSVQLGRRWVLESPSTVAREMGYVPIRTRPRTQVAPHLVSPAVRSLRRNGKFSTSAHLRS